MTLLRKEGAMVKTAQVSQLAHSTSISLATKRRIEKDVSPERGEKTFNKKLSSHSQPNTRNDTVLVADKNEANGGRILATVGSRAGHDAF